MFLKLFLIAYVVAFVCGKNELYMGYRIYKVKFDTQEQQNKLHLLKSDMVDYLRKPVVKHGVSGLAMVPPSHLQWFEEKLAEVNVTKDIVTDDVYKYLQEKNDKSYAARNDTEFDLYRYYRYDEILNYLKAIEEAYSNSNEVSIELVEAGVTDEQRSLVYLKLTSGLPSQGVEKSVVIIEAGVNPREWITISSAINIVNKLVEENQKRFLDNLEWIIIPVLNPDGYEYTHTNLRLWTKTRSTRSHLGPICPGVNINRNFDIDWMVSDTSSSPCSHIYGGVEAFSEPETRVIRDIIDKYRSSIRLFISLQNNGEFISYPWQYERAASGMFRQHHLLGFDMISGIENYKLDIGSEALGDRASGTSSDYVMNNGILYTFNVNIGNRGDGGVVVPEEEIASIADKVWNVVAIAADGVIDSEY